MTSNTNTSMGPSVCYKVEKIIGMSVGEGNVRNYQVQWSPSWISSVHLVGCESLIEEFTQHQQQPDGGKCDGNPTIAKQNTQRPLEEFICRRMDDGEKYSTHQTSFMDERTTMVCGNVDHSYNKTGRTGTNETLIDPPSLIYPSSDDCAGKLSSDVATLQNYGNGNDGKYNDATATQQHNDDYHMGVRDKGNQNLEGVLNVSDDSMFLNNVVESEEIIVVEPQEFEDNKINESDIIYNCSKCQNTFESAIELKHHTKRVHSKVDNILAIVERDKNSSIDMRITTHANNADNEGSTSEYFRGNNNKCNNINDNVGNSSHNFDNCSNISNNNDNNNNYINYYNNVNSDINNFILRNSDDSDNHTNTTKNKPQKLKTFECGFCKKMFSNNSNMQVHMRMHTGLRSHQCTFCDKLFPSRTELRRHERVHTGERPFVCRVCDKSFKRNDHLKKHIQTHNVPM